MREGCIKIGIFIVMLSVGLYFIKNREEICSFVNSKIKNILLKIIYFLIILIILVCLIVLCKRINKYLKFGNVYVKNEEDFKEVDEKISIEDNIYSDLIKKDYENQKPNEPYIPDGFSYVEGNWENGYVIQDENQNEYVWVPCTNKISNTITRLKRQNAVAVPFVNYTSCYNESYEKFLKSALENGGFYISRYEIGNENEIPVSKKNVPIITNITREEAIEIVDKMYDNINCELINGYAYDTALKWVEKSNYLEMKIIEITKNENVLSGRNLNCNIYDFCDNVLEYSLENLYDTIIIRGFVNSDSTEFTRSLFSKESRYCMPIQDSSFGGVIPVAIRTIIYK